MVIAIQTNLLKHSIDFSILIAWSGEENKPYYRAVLLSASRTAAVADKPFWGYAVISTTEFGQLLDVIAATGRMFAVGSYMGQAEEYYVEIETAMGVYHSSLGFDQGTVRILNHMADVLEPAHQPPIRNIVSRISSAVQSNPLQSDGI